MQEPLLGECLFGHSNFHVNSIQIVGFLYFGWLYKSSFGSVIRQTNLYNVLSKLKPRDQALPSLKQSNIVMLIFSKEFSMHTKILIIYYVSLLQWSSLCYLRDFTHDNSKV